MKEFKCIYSMMSIFLVVGFLCLPAGMARGETKVIVGSNSDARSLDPVLTMDATTTRVLRHIYDGLFFRDRSMKVIPELAESYKFVDDLMWVIKLKKGIKFHNGEPFNAESVKFTIDFVLDPTNKAFTRTLIDRIDRVEMIDDYTVKIITKQAFPTLLENLIEVFMAPPKLAKEKGMGYLSDHPVGTGAYKLESWSKDREIVFVKNENYWKGIPPIDKVVFRIIPEVGPRVSALVVGEVDLIPDVPPHLINQINNSKVATVKGVPGRRIIFVGFDNIMDGPVKDVRVRQALNYGVDVDEIIRTVMEGYATRTPGPLTPINKHFDPSLKPYPYDPEKAKKLLQEAGYGSGLNLTFHSPQGRYLKDKEFVQAIAAQLGKIGVNVKVIFYEWGTYLKSLGRKFNDMHINGRSDRELEGGIMYAWFKTGAQWVSFSDPEIDKELDKTMPIIDSKERTKAFKQLQAKVQQAAPWIFLWEQHDLYGVSNRLDWEPRADEQFYLYNAKVKK